MKTNYIEFNSEYFKRVRQLKPTPGYCILIDIVGSTVLKREASEKWITQMKQIFDDIRQVMNFTSFFKSIGDCFMCFIRDADFQKNGVNNANVLADRICDLINMQMLNSSCHQIKAALVYSHADCYELSFIKDTADIYGNGIDLAFRLLSLANENEVLMNYEAYERVKTLFDEKDPDREYQSKMHFQGPWRQSVKGFADAIEIYKICGKK